MRLLNWIRSKDDWDERLTLIIICCTPGLVFIAASNLPWHWFTVATLATAIMFEGLAGYCHQARQLATVQNSEEPFPGGLKTLWLFAFVRRRTMDGVSMARPHFDLLRPEFGTVLRGVSRVGVGVVFLVGYAQGQPPPWAAFTC